MTLDSVMGLLDGGETTPPPVVPLPLALDAATRTSLMRSVVVLGGTDQVSTNCCLPSLLYCTV